MTLFAEFRFYYPNDHYVSAVILFDTDDFLEATKLANAFASGINTTGEVRAIILSMSTTPQSTINLFSYRSTNELGLFISKYAPN